MERFNYKSLGIGSLLGIGVIAGVLSRIFFKINFPEVGLLINLILLPSLLIFLSSLLIYKGFLKKIESGFWSLCSIILSNLIGIIIYGMTAGWWYVTKDTESQLALALIVLAQLTIYFIGYVLLSVLITKNKSWLKSH